MACGNGNAALAAARRFCQVVGVDYVPALLDRARRRAEAEGLEVSFQEADAEALPFPDDSFDVVLSTCGAMFAPDQERTAAELLRVCRPGGRIGMVNWTPDSYVGELFRTIGRYRAASAGTAAARTLGRRRSAARAVRPRGRPSRRRGAASCGGSRRPSTRRSSSPRFYGPANRAAAALAADRAAELKAEMLDVVKRFNVSGDETLVLRMDYLEAVIQRPAIG